MTMVCWETAPPATPVIRARLETRPSMAPKTAGRSQPPLTSRWVWLSRWASCSTASVSMMDTALPFSGSGPRAIASSAPTQSKVRTRKAPRQQGRPNLPALEDAHPGGRSDTEPSDSLRPDSGEPSAWHRCRARAREADPGASCEARSRIGAVTARTVRRRTPVTGPGARCWGSRSGTRSAPPRRTCSPSEIRRRWGRIEGFVERRSGGHRRHRVRDLLRAAAGQARLGADRLARRARPGTTGSPTWTRARSGARGSASAARWRTCAAAWPPRSRPSTGTPGATVSRCGRRRSGSSRRAAPPRPPGWWRSTAGQPRRARASTAARRSRRGSRPRWSGARARLGDRRRALGRPDGLLDGPLAAPRGHGRAALVPGPAGRERAVRSAVVIGGYPWTDLAPEAVGLAFGALRGGAR